MATVITAYLVLIGNELLSGKVRDTNGTFAVEALRSRGVDVLGVEVIPDEEPRIVETIRRVRSTLRPSVVITSGGIGPTHDDVTMAALAKALDRPLQRQPALVEKIRAHYGERTNDDVLAMADLPEGTVLSFGSSFFPLIRIDDVCALPGDPTFFRDKVALLLNQLGPAVPFATRRIHIASEEGRLAPVLRTLQADCPDVAIGSYPRYDAGYGRWVTQVTLDGRDVGRVRDVHERLLAALPSGATVLETDVS